MIGSIFILSISLLYLGSGSQTRALSSPVKPCPIKGLSFSKADCPDPHFVFGKSKTMMKLMFL